MDAIFKSIAINSDSTKETVKFAVGTMLNFVCCIISREHASKLTGSLVGARDVMNLRKGTGSNGLMGTYDELKSLGLDLNKIQSIAKELVGHLRNVVSENLINEIKDAILSESPFWIRFKIKSVISDW